MSGGWQSNVAGCRTAGDRNMGVTSLSGTRYERDAKAFDPRLSFNCSDTAFVGLS